MGFGGPSITSHEASSNAIPLNLEFGRVTVLLGANGSGKSRALTQFVATARNIWPGRPVVYIEGGRAIEFPEQLPPSSRAWDENTLEKQVKGYKQKHREKLSNRLKELFTVLVNRGRRSERDHYRAILKWIEEGRQGEPPPVGEHDLNRLFELFASIFPEISLRVENRRVICSKNGSDYRVSGLSDGERQVLMFLGDIGFLADSNAVFIVDEPELNLHPSLSCSLWEAIETERPDALFVYASHSLSFAMRPGVDQLYVLSAHAAPLCIKDIRSLGADQARPLLGAIPSILFANKALAVEGNDASFDSEFYKWVLGDNTTAFVPLGSCDDVRAAVTKTGIWNLLAPSVRIKGVIDRDFRSSRELSGKASPDCYVLDYHEAESYLCHPQLLAHLGRSLSLKDPISTEAELLDLIVKWAEPRLVWLAAVRCSKRASLYLNVSLPRQLLRHEITEDVAKSHLASASETERRKSDSINAVETTRIFEEELSACRKAVADRNIEELLRLWPGKELVVILSKNIGCQDQFALLRAARKHLQVRDWPWLENLRVQLQFRDDALPDVSGEEMKKT